MKLSHLILGMIPLALAAVSSAATQPAAGGLVYAVTYFEAAAPDVAHAAALTRQFAAASLKEPNNAGFEAFQEIGRPSRIATLEAWHDKAGSARSKSGRSTGFLSPRPAHRAVPLRSMSSPMSMSSRQARTKPGRWSRRSLKRGARCPAIYGSMFCKWTAT